MLALFFHKMTIHTQIPSPKLLRDYIFIFSNPYSLKKTDGEIEVMVKGYMIQSREG